MPMITNTLLLQKSISKVLPNSKTQSFAEIFLLLLTGMFAILLHTKLRIPLQLPGRQGVLFMTILVTGRLLSKYKYAGTMQCLGASTLLLSNALDFDDPFMAPIYILVGLTFDSLLNVFRSIFSREWILPLFSGIALLMIPLLRLLIQTFTGFPFHSLMRNQSLPFITHFIFGIVGGFLALAIFSVVNRNQQKG
jgi:hypothetical protein